MSYRVLVAEDEEIIRKGIIMSVDWTALGCGRIDEASDGQETVNKLLSEAYDIVLLDINMPLICGLDVISLTRDEREYVPIIVTGYAEFELAKRAMSLGVDNYILKPIHSEELTEAIRHAGEERERRAAYLKYKLTVDSDKVLNGPQEIRNAAVARMIEYVQTHYAERANLYEIAQELHYSETYLTRKFKEEIGMTYSEYLNRYRIRQAMQQIAKDLSCRLSSVGAACGFGEYSYFVGVFRKYVGCTPKEYRNSLKQKAETSR